MDKLWSLCRVKSNWNMTLRNAVMTRRSRSWSWRKSVLICSYFLHSSVIQFVMRANECCTQQVENQSDDERHSQWNYKEKLHFSFETIATTTRKNIVYVFDEQVNILNRKFCSCILHFLRIACSHEWVLFLSICTWHVNS